MTTLRLDAPESPRTPINEASPPPPPPPVLIGISGAPLSPLDWPTYLEWRKTKCRPFDREALEAIGDRDRLLEEIDQATHELVGEVAELGELFIQGGPTALVGEDRDRLIDECGDIFFCGAWALDAWGENPLYDAVSGLELIQVDPGSQTAHAAAALSANPLEFLGNVDAMRWFCCAIFHDLAMVQVSVGLTANAFKKLKFQGRDQDIPTQVSRIAAALVSVNKILYLAGSSVEEALRANQRKLNHRFPNGYVPGSGGGNRTGEGR